MGVCLGPCSGIFMTRSTLIHNGGKAAIWSSHFLAGNMRITCALELTTSMRMYFFHERNTCIVHWEWGTLTLFYCNVMNQFRICVVSFDVSSLFTWRQRKRDNLMILYWNDILWWTIRSRHHWIKWLICAIIIPMTCNMQL